MTASDTHGQGATNSPIKESRVRPRTVTGLAALALGSVALAGCSGSGGPSRSNASAASSQAKAAPTTSYNIVVVAGAFSDPFFNAMKQGVDAAAKAYGVNVKWDSSDITGSALAQTIQTAAATNPDGMVVGDWYPSSEDPKIQALASQGKPIVDMNAAGTDWQSKGFLSFVGMDNYQSGVMAADQFVAAGVKNGLCVNHIPGSPLTDSRCAGFSAEMAKKGGTTATLNIPYKDSTNPAAITQDIKGYLTTHTSTDAIFTLGTPEAADAVDALNSSGSGAKSTKIGTSDLSNQVLTYIQSGKVLFAVNQEPYLQGYYSVADLADYLKYHLALTGQVSTGPLAVTSANVGSYLSANQKFPGILGAS